LSPSTKNKWSFEAVISNVGYFVLIVKNEFSWIHQNRDYVNFKTMIQKEIEKRIFDEITLLNVSDPSHSNTKEAKNALYVLKTCILPYSIRLREVLEDKIKLSNKKKKR